MFNSTTNLTATCDNVLQCYTNFSLSASLKPGHLTLNESIVSSTSNTEILLQLLQIEKHEIKTGEVEGGALIALARAILEGK